MNSSQVLGQWIILSGALENGASAPPTGSSSSRGFRIGILEPQDLDYLSSLGPKGRLDADILESADISIVARDVQGRVVHFQCMALASFIHRGLPLPVRVDPGVAFSYHVETARSFRGQGLARAGLSAAIGELQGRGVTRISTYTTDINLTVRHMYREFGFEEVGTLLKTRSEGSIYWIQLGGSPVLLGEPALGASGIHVHKEGDSATERLRQELEECASWLRQEGATVALLGCGLAASELVKLVPGIKPLIVGVADSDIRRVGETFAPTGHIVVPAKRWSSTGATHLLYATGAFQDEMHQQHVEFGPTGSLGIRLHPRVEIVVAELEGSG